MKSLIYANLILWAVIMLTGCRDNSPVSSPGQRDAEPNVSNSVEPTPSDTRAIPDADTITIIGMVVHKNLEGGFFAIDGDDGSKYNPIGLPEDFQKNGLKVKVVARLKTDAMSIHMYGSIIEIVDIAVR